MKVVITDSTYASFEEEQAVSKRAGFDLQILKCKTEDEVIEACADADALLVNFAPITDKVLSNLKQCKVLVRYGIGVDNVDLEAAKKYGVPICNVPDYGVEEVADHAVALSLSLIRQIPYFDTAIRNGEWPGTPPKPLFSFRDMNFVALGAGQIGRAALKRVQAFGFNCFAYDPFVSAEDMEKIGVQKIELDDAFVKADLLSLHLPLLESTRHTVNKERLESMKKSAIVVNTSRGGLIDTLALSEALDQGEIAYAGLDVFESEPMEIDHPLRSNKNALLTPHVAYYSIASMQRLQRYAAEEVERALKGEPLRCQVA